MNEETVELTAYLDEIAERSIRGHIQWAQPNPATFQWNQTQFIVTIQKAVAPKTIGGMLIDQQQVVDYLFQVVDRGNRQAVVSLSSKERPEFAKPLAALYRAVERGMDLRATNVLKQVLGG